MPKYTFTSYFKNDVLTKRPYLKKEWCIYVIENPIRCEPQEDNRFRFWAKIEELPIKYTIRQNKNKECKINKDETDCLPCYAKMLLEDIKAQLRKEFEA